MGYAVAKELKMRPMDILNTWTCEELLVAFGVYSNQKSHANFSMMSIEEKKRKKIDEMERWAIPFISYTQLEELENKIDDQDLDELAKIGEAIFGF